MILSLEKVYSKKNSWFSIEHDKCTLNFTFRHIFAQDSKFSPQIFPVLKFLNQGLYYGSWNTVPVRHPPTAHCEANKTPPCRTSTLFVREKYCTFTAHCLKIAKKVSFKFRERREHLHGQKIIKNGQFLGVLKQEAFGPAQQCYQTGHFF